MAKHKPYQGIRYDTPGAYSHTGSPPGHPQGPIAHDVGSTYNAHSGGTAPVGGFPQPPDWQQQAYEAGQQRNVQYADAQAAYDQNRIQRDFGYGAGGQVDPNNPYSKAALLERNFRQQQQGDTNNYAAQGQLYSGALQNQKQSTLFNYLSNSNSLKNQYADAQGQTTLNQLGAYANAGSGISTEKINALLRALGQA